MCTSTDKPPFFPGNATGLILNNKCFYPTNRALLCKSNAKAKDCTDPIESPAVLNSRPKLKYLATSQLLSVTFQRDATTGKTLELLLSCGNGPLEKDGLTLELNQANETILTGSSSFVCSEAAGKKNRKKDGGKELDPEAERLRREESSCVLRGPGSEDVQFNLTRYGFPKS